jgi:hypothetical protein
VIGKRAQMDKGIRIGSWGQLQGKREFNYIEVN